MIDRSSPTQSNVMKQWAPEGTASRARAIPCPWTSWAVMMHDPQARAAETSAGRALPAPRMPICTMRSTYAGPRSEEHTSELQSRVDLVCRLLLEKKKKKKTINTNNNKTQETDT